MTRHNGPKIAIVGGGSYAWCPLLLGDIVQTPEFDGVEIALLDPDLGAARDIEACGQALATHFQRSCRFHVTRNEATAFRGADFVIVTISTGGFDAMRHDLAIPEKYGIYHTVGDTVGPGGWSRALRNIPVFVGLAQNIERYAPRATVLNYTNPMASLTGALCAVSRLRSVGLCHGVFETYAVLEKLFDVREQDLCVRFGGVNHFFFVLDFTVRGKPGYPLLRKRLQNHSLDAVLAEGETDGHGFHSHHALLDEFYRQYGYLGFAGDRHTCEGVPYCLTPEPAGLKRFHLARTSIRDRREGRRRQIRHARALAAGRETPPPPSREAAVNMMKAILTGQPIIDVGNLPNVGQIDNLPRNAVVETLVLVDSLGFRPITTGPLPPILHGLVDPHCRCQQMTLEAALSGNRELALQALMLDPLCAHLPPSETRKMGLELLAATRPWLPMKC